MNRRTSFLDSMGIPCGEMWEGVISHFWRHEVPLRRTEAYHCSHEKVVEFSSGQSCVWPKEPGGLPTIWGSALKAWLKVSVGIGALVHCGAVVSWSVSKGSSSLLLSGVLLGVNFGTFDGVCTVVVVSCVFVDVEMCCVELFSGLCCFVSVCEGV